MSHDGRFIDFLLPLQHIIFNDCVSLSIAYNIIIYMYTKEYSRSGIVANQ